MKMRLKRVNMVSQGYQPNRFIVQRKWFIFWLDCEAGVEGIPYIPTFGDARTAYEFGHSYAQRTKENVIWKRS